MGFVGELSPRDVPPLLDRGITRKALRALVRFVLRMVDTTHFRHFLLDFLATPDFCTLVTGGEYVFVSWLRPVPGMLTPCRLGRVMHHALCSGRTRLSSD